MRKTFFSLLLLLLLLPCGSSFAAGGEEHIVEKGETALQIAIDHDLTMEQLQQLNPGKDLEMMRVGDSLTVPGEGYGSFEDFLADLYSDTISADKLRCTLLTDGSAACFAELTNHTEKTLTSIRYEVTATDPIGMRDSVEASFPLAAMEPGETVPVVVLIPGPFSAAPEAKFAVRQVSQMDLGAASFRIDESQYQYKVSYLPGNIAASVTLDFLPEYAALSHEKHLNILIGAWDSDGNPVGVRSFYGEFIDPMTVTVYSVGGSIENVQIYAEAY